MCRQSQKLFFLSFFFF
uniref:Uncharacterized protein n=1 Tax=Anguilla anguilla TaxID=7936 RepID=A0A0E9TTE1_ANGAN